MPHQRNPNDQSAHLPISHSSVVSIADGINDKQRPFVFTPLSLFKAAQACLFKGPSSVAFAQRTHNQLSAWYPSEVPISFTSSSSKNSFALDEKGASEPSTTPLYGSDPFSSLHFSPSPDAYQMEEKPPGAGMPGAVADESKLGRKPSTPTRTKRVQPLVYEGDPKPDLLHIQPPRPAKSPKRASNRPVPPKYPDEAVPDPSPPLSNHPFRTSQRLDNAQSNEVSTPAPAHLRTSVSEALPSHPWSSDYLTPREQARLVNLQDAAIVRRSNYDWAERAANELKKAPEEP